MLREVLLFAGALASGTPVAAMAMMPLTDLRSRDLAAVGHGIWQRAETGEISIYEPRDMAMGRGLRPM